MNEIGLSFTVPASTRVHLGVCGSVAAYRALDLIRMLQRMHIGVSVTLTDAAQRFVAPLGFSALGASPVYTSMFDDVLAPSPFAHLEPGQISHAMLIAPASAAMLSRLAYGQADHLLACQALAHKGSLLIAPAMNPAMWDHPATQASVSILQDRGAVFVMPDYGDTACGDTGQGRLADIRHIALATLRAVMPQDMQGKRVMLTLGPTREAWDAVRFWSNPSTGTMGASLAIAAWLRGAQVDVICGPTAPLLLPNDAAMRRHDVISASDMYAVAAELWPQIDVGIFTAAVADFSPERPNASGGAAGKFKKSESADGLSIRFAPTTDILQTLATQKREGQYAIGFAAESSDLETAVKAKLQSKNADMIVGNLVQDGFGTFSNTVYVEDRLGRFETWVSEPKTTIAMKVLSWFLSL